MEFDGRMSVGNAGGALGLRAGVGFLGPTRLEARYLRASVDAAGESASMTEIAGQLRLTVPVPVVQPYGFVGLARRSTDVSSGMTRTSDDAWMLPYGAGIDIPLLPFFVLAPELTWHRRLSDEPLVPVLAGGDSWNLSLVVRLDL